MDIKNIANVIGGGLTKGALNPILGLLNSGLSLIRDKTRDADESFIHEKVKKGISISSKRVLNLTGTPVLIGLGITQIVTGHPFLEGVALIGLGVVYSLGLSYITHLSEKNKRS